LPRPPFSTLSLGKSFSPAISSLHPQLLECVKLRWQIPTNDLEQAKQELPQSANIHPLIQNISLYHKETDEFVQAAQPCAPGFQEVNTAATSGRDVQAN